MPETPKVDFGSEEEIRYRSHQRGGGGVEAGFNEKYTNTGG